MLGGKAVVESSIRKASTTIQPNDEVSFLLRDFILDLDPMHISKSRFVLLPKIVCYTCKLCITNPIVTYISVTIIWLMVLSL